MYVFPQLATQSQELYDHNLSLQESVHTLEKAAVSDRSRLTAQLVKELTMCVQELQQLVELCSQRAEGQEPNVSLLLGFRCKFFSCLFICYLFIYYFVYLFVCYNSFMLLCSQVGEGQKPCIFLLLVFRR